MGLQVDVRSRSAGLPIGVVATRFGLAPHVLRHWEATGLLRPARSADGRRRYDSQEMTRVAVILRAKAAGLSLNEIRRVLAADPVARRRILERQRVLLAERIAQDQARLAVLDCAVACAHEDVADCPHVRQVTSDGAAAGP
ncbi:helix-turn-helix domain-containing protein [Micromonospora tarensis]|uniref:MerR family transcriptional regulator n=1 Tax=Micromonospora tarensis TaxID=2806100 RepID=A0ABS1YFW4_9ACTN|nr:MerR family transcriptional regulator [Micromonospora tarensis]MBM0276303.1 MerR family transcriptional regulator [Micromonospora tarensis]